MTCSINDGEGLEADLTIVINGVVVSNQSFLASSAHGGAPVVKSRRNDTKIPSTSIRPKESSIPFTGGARHHPETTDEAREQVGMFLQHSRRLSSRKILEVPTFDARELHLGRWLGSGGFSHVEELRGILDIPGGSRKSLGAASRRRLYSLLRMSSKIVEEDPTEPEASSIHSSGSGEPLAHELGYEPDRVEMEEEEDTETSETNEDAVEPIPPENTEAARRFLVQNCLRSSGESRYAIKRLRKEIVQDPQQYPSGAMDLAAEALFLTNLQHPNIIKCRAIGTTDPFVSKPSHDDYYFLVLDRLYDTLTDRMARWKEGKRKLKTLIGRITDVGGRKRRALLDERLAAAFDLSAALAYLKENRIIHRDIKPENLGFDIRGDIKVFDFGLARELRDVDRDPDLKGMYRLSNMTGSLRYMAPEVGSVATPYNEACDVYSFTVVLWEMLSLQRAYMDVGVSQALFMRSVFAERMRPPLRHSWSRNLQELFKGGWAHDPRERLTAEKCNEMLRNELVAMRHGDDEGLDHVRRRSTYILEEEEAARSGWARSASTSDVVEPRKNRPQRRSSCTELNIHGSSPF
ncbi:Probable LIM domain-containing serine/threonine-protein kinase DDB [Seminavis robusta]|uniref:Probable LIM domain-containing serine/threonine-protein kinase DDB n=1 Tax=Seminavis robusta TaxID=568900 RepID=A0A9N8DKW0_9STRA|nr:Probable LIM domain-containing serine/threonine-protein kinase DDB [Seminavis robusta]|eukprot:Sro198_g084100.1 Probable LIM domain-containing serine/threonine-protein kinase DDB (577) ;mRNA; f:55164-57056